MTLSLPREALEAAFGERLKVSIGLARYTASRIGGPADALVEIHSSAELERAARRLWTLDVPFLVLGGGSNILVSDAGIHQVVLWNRARRVRFSVESNPPTVWAESGSNFGSLARQAASRGLGGLSWGAGIPGTVGGAVVGNAGAHGGEMAGNLLVAEILHHSRGLEHWGVDRLEYAYRSSALKRDPGQAVVLAATLRLERSTKEAVQEQMDEYLAYRRQTQPPGASMGSMFKNPPGDYAGRLIEAAGLKGTVIGGAQISPLHANFFINHGGATADDVYRLLRLARQEVAERFAVELELEIELLGDWSGYDLD